MRKYQVTMYTFTEGDKLYYLDKDEIKSVTLTKEHLHKSNPKEILEDYVLKPDEKVEQKRHGKLALWKAYTKDNGWLKSDAPWYHEDYDYSKVNSPFAVDKKVLEKELEKRNTRANSEVDSRIVEKPQQLEKLEEIKDNMVLTDSDFDLDNTLEL